MRKIGHLNTPISIPYVHRALNICATIGHLQQPHVNAIRHQNPGALHEVNPVIKTPEFQQVESAIQSGERLSLDGARALDNKGKQLENNQTFKALLNKLL